LTVLLRRLGEADADRFLQLRQDGAIAAADSFRFDAVDDFALDRPTLLARLARATVLGIFEDATLVAIGGVEPFQGRKLAHKWLLWGMYVARPGQGYGERIVHELVMAAENGGAASVQLTLMADNARARALYERCDFVAYGVEPQSVLRNGIFADELLMWRRLREEPTG
jgi:RimJ/RimL family protein N-acetyltransferase